jgi:uncharacterized OB-fold protein
LNTDRPPRQRDSSPDQSTGANASVNLPATVRCHQCGREANVLPQQPDPNKSTGQTEGYDQQDRHEGYLVAIDCPKCGHVMQRLTADDA